MTLKGINNQCKKCGSVNTYCSQTHIVCRKCSHRMILQKNVILKKMIIKNNSQAVKSKTKNKKEKSKK